MSGTIIRKNGTDGIIIDARTIPGRGGYALTDVLSRENGGHGMAVHVGSTAIARLKVTNSEFIANGKDGMTVTSTAANPPPLTDLLLANSELINNGQYGVGYKGFSSMAPLVRPRFIGNLGTDTGATNTGSGSALRFTALSSLTTLSAETRRTLPLTRQRRHSSSGCRVLRTRTRSRISGATLDTPSAMAHQNP